MNGTRPAGFWVRAGALLIDLAVLALVKFSLGVAARRVSGTRVEDSPILQVAVFVFTLAFAGLYVTLLHAVAGQTIGKSLLRMRVVLVDGEPVPVGTSLLRFLAYFLSCATFGFGYLIAGLRHDKRALHDLIAGTRVERAPERPPAPVEPLEAITTPVA